MSSDTFSWSSLRRLVYHRRFYVFRWNRITHRLKHSHSHILSTTKHRQQHRYVLADGNVAIIMLKACTVIWHSLLSRKNHATDASSKSAIAHVGANCGPSWLYSLEHFHVQFSRFPRHQGVTHWEGDISEGDMVPSCQVSRCPPLRYGAVLSGLAMSTLVIWCRLVRSRDFSAPKKIKVQKLSFSCNFLKDFVREKAELTWYAQLKGFILVGSSKAVCI